MVTDNQVFNIDDIKFAENGLVPVIVQDSTTNNVLMLAYMNAEAINKTIAEKMAHYYSRSRQTLWKKGETSGHWQYVESMYYDCDADTLLLKVKQIGPACHTNQNSCFHHKVFGSEPHHDVDILKRLFRVIKERKKQSTDESYTGYLFRSGIDKILKKVGEETSEVIIASKNESPEELVFELADLTYHLLVLMVERDIDIDVVAKELSNRRGLSDENH